MNPLNDLNQLHSARQGINALLDPSGEPLGFKDRDNICQLFDILNNQEAELLAQFESEYKAFIDMLPKNNVG